jgi:hypothetical protein
MRKNTPQLSFLFLPLFCFLVGCGMGALSPQPQPTTLQVTRTSTFHGSQRFWTLTDGKRVHQLFQEIQQLPVHQNKGADSCVTYPYDYSLNFLVGTTRIQQDDLGRYCGTLTGENGRHFNLTVTFTSLFLNLLHMNDLWTASAAPSRCLQRWE